MGGLFFDEWSELIAQDVKTIPAHVKVFSPFIWYDNISCKITPPCSCSTRSFPKASRYILSLGRFDGTVVNSGDFH